jgi:hypothetical protein
MKEGNWPLLVACSVLVLALAASLDFAQGTFEIVRGRKLKDAIPHDFYLEGSALPVETRNALLIKTPSGTRVLMALVVTSGWASQLPSKYSGMLISEGMVSLCGHPLMAGSYGFGLHRPAMHSLKGAEFVLYNQAGQKIWDCVTRKDLRLPEPRPLQAVLDSRHLARVYLGRYGLELRP